MGTTLLILHSANDFEKKERQAIYIWPLRITHKKRIWATVPEYRYDSCADGELNLRRVRRPARSLWPRGRRFTRLT
jgi:hypothetical protein